MMDLECKTLSQLNLHRFMIIYDGKRWLDNGKQAYVVAKDAGEAKVIASRLYFLPVLSLLQVVKVPD